MCFSGNNNAMPAAAPAPMNAEDYAAFVALSVNPNITLDNLNLSEIRPMNFNAAITSIGVILIGLGLGIGITIDNPYRDKVYDRWAITTGMTMTLVGGLIVLGFGSRP